MIKKLLAFVIMFLFIGASVVSSTDNKVKDVSLDYQLLKSNNNTSRNLFSCDHLAYISGDTDCFLYEFMLSDPGDLTCICSVNHIANFMSGSSWSNNSYIYACEYNTGSLWRFDVETCEWEVIGGGGICCHGLAWDPVYNRLYGTSGTALIEYDPETGEQEVIGSFGLSGKTIIDIAIDSEGVAYIWDVVFSGQSTLWIVDLETCETTEVGPLGFSIPYIQEGDFCFEDDILYIVAGTSNPSYTILLECDEDTGNCTLVGQFQDNVTISLFVIQNNFPPYIPSHPTPPCGTKGVSINTELGWVGGDPNEDFVVYDIYFGNYTPPPQVAGNLSNTHFFPETLENCTTYYWQICAWDENGGYTEGPIWNFTTNCEPDVPTIDGPIKGKPGIEYKYSFISIDPDGYDMYYIIDWDDGSYDETDYSPSGVEIYISHSWAKKGTYTIRAKAVDEYGAESEWGELQVTMPRNKATSNVLLLRLLEKFPLLQRLMDIWRFNI